jgi:hypothetical protein
MVMIEFFITLLLALQAGTLCQQGIPVDWGEWLDSHPYAERVGEVRYQDEFEFWLIDGDGVAERPSAEDGLVLFVFDTREGRYPHGQCARQL